MLYLLLSFEPLYLHVHVCVCVCFCFLERHKKNVFLPRLRNADVRLCSKAPQNLVDGKCDSPLITRGKPATYLSWEDIGLGYETPTMTSLYGAQPFERRGNRSHAASVSRSPSLSSVISL